jgi:Flp pilus assembly protein TadD
MAVLVIAVISIASFRQAGFWRDNQAICAQVIRVNPRSFAAYTLRAADFQHKGLDGPAEADLRAAVAINPDYGYAHMSLGMLLMKKGDATGAAVEFRELQRVYASQRNYDPSLADSVDAALKRRLQQASSQPGSQ